MRSGTKDVNEVCFIGKRATDFRYSHRYRGESFYRADFIAERDSGVLDRIPVTVSAWQRRLLSVSGNGYVRIAGQFRSCNCSGQGRRLILSVFAEEVDVFVEEKDHVGRNHIYLEGYVCRKPVYRTTPAGLRITDIMLAVNRPCNGSDYLPCISWGKYARRAAGFPVGGRIWLRGRIQSREYIKKKGDGKKELHTTYEVSAFGTGRLA